MKTRRHRKFEWGAGGYWQSAKRRSGGEERGANEAVQLEDGTVAKFDPVMVRRCRQRSVNHGKESKRRSRRKDKQNLRNTKLLPTVCEPKGRNAGVTDENVGFEGQTDRA